MKKLHAITLLPALFCLSVSTALAQDGSPPPVAPAGSPGENAPAATATEEPLKNLTPGVVASYGKFTMRGKALSQGLDKNVPGDGETMTVTGSVKKFGSTRCAAVLVNSSEKSTYSVNFELLKSTKETVNSPSKKLFSATLGPKKSVEREFSCTPADNFQLVLKSGKEIKREK